MRRSSVLSLTTCLPLLRGILQGAAASRVAETRRLRLALVGDVHGQYEEDDNLALMNLAPDAVLFVGDFDNEQVPVVQTIATLQESLPCATIFGNHDVCSLSKFYRNKDRNKQQRKDEWDPGAAATAGAPTTGSLPPRLGLDKRYNAVREQHELLTKSNCAWGRIDFANLGLSVAGGRPFSSGGGDHVGHKQGFYRDLFGIDSTEASAELIARNVNAAPADAVTVVLAHNGPTGLGDGPTDICGRDWLVQSGRRRREDPADWGDQDLELGLSLCPAPVPLVVFGHMHHQSRDGTLRTMATHAHERLYVNAAHVPRWRRTPRGRERAFTFVDLVQESWGDEDSAGGTAWRAPSADLVWALPSGEVVERTPLWPPPACDDKSQA